MNKLLLLLHVWLGTSAGPMTNSELLSENILSINIATLLCKYISLLIVSALIK